MPDQHTSAADRLRAYLEGFDKGEHPGGYGCETPAEGYRAGLFAAIGIVENHPDEVAAMLAEARIDAIVEFVGRQGAEYRKHSAQAIDEDIALAVGMGVPRERFYDEPANPTAAEVGEAIIATGADPDALEGLVDNLNRANAELAAALPDRPDTLLRSDRDGITELATYLATVHTAAALAEDIPRLIGEIDITAYTADIGEHLAAAAAAAVARIRDLALAADDDEGAEFPPRAYRLNTAGDYLASLHGRALALAAHAEAVRAEIECYLEPEPEPDTEVDEVDTEREEHPDA